MNNPKILILPDIHGRAFYQKALYEAVDKGAEIVCLGDYLDPYTRHEGINPGEAYVNFKEIVEFARANPLRVILLYGNHKILNFS